MKIYKYKDIEYKTESQLRKVVWYKERKALPKVSSVEEWAKYGVEIKEVKRIVAEEQKARNARSVRDRLLAACDYYVMPDYPSTEEGLIDVKAYRQALRDITKQEGFPSEIIWPVNPKVLG